MKNWLPLVLGPELAMARRPGLSKFRLGSNSSSKLVAGIAHAGAGGVAALDHEFGNDAMEDGAVVVGLVVLLLVGGGSVQSLVPSARPMKLATALGACR
jgi:hypothetical protein